MSPAVRVDQCRRGLKLGRAEEEPGQNLRANLTSCAAYARFFLFDFEAESSVHACARARVRCLAQSWTESPDKCLLDRFVPS